MRVLEVVSDPDAVARILHGDRAPPAPPPPASSCCSPDHAPFGDVFTRPRPHVVLAAPLGAVVADQLLWVEAGVAVRAAE